MIKFTMLTYLNLAFRYLISQLTMVNSEVDSFICIALKLFKHAREIIVLIMVNPSCETNKEHLIYDYLAENIAYDETLFG